MSDVTDSSINKSNANISNSKLQELNDLVTMFKKERTKYIKNEILKEIILEATDPKYNVNEGTGVKTRDIILRRELLKNLSVKDKHSQPMPLLDLVEFTNIKLTFEQQKSMKTATEQRLREKNEELLVDIKDVTDCDANSIQEIIENFKFDAQTQEDNVISSQKKIKELHKTHINALLKLGDVLLKLVKLRTELAPKHMEEKAEELLCESEKFKLRFRILEQKMQLSMFTESPMTLEAYRQAYKDMKEQQAEYTKEIEALRVDIDKYNFLLRSEEYQEILKDYKQYIKGIENKRWLHSELLKK